MKRYSLILIIVAAFALRVWGIDFGLPYVLHQDEPIVVNHAMAYGTGDFNPHFFIIPPFCSYVLFFFYAGFFVIGKIIGLFPDASAFALAFFKDPSIFYLIARSVLGVIPSVISVGLIYVLYKKFFSERGAWYSALLAALAFLNVVNGHYAYVDNVMVMLILAVYVLIVGITERPSLGKYVLAGLFLGFAISAKYNASILVASCYFAHVSAIHLYGLDKKRLIFDRNLAVALIVAVIAFILTNPFAVLDWGFFQESIFGKIRHSYMGPLHHIYYSLFQGMGVLPVAAGAIGGIAILSREKWTKSFLFLSFPLVFYVHLIFASQSFSRYVLPIVPFLVIAAAYLFYELWLPRVKGRFHKATVVFLSLVIVLPTAAKSLKACSLFSADDTRSVSTQWIMDNIPSSAVIAVDHTSFRPQILQTEDQIKDKKEVAGFQEGLGPIKTRKIDLMMRAQEGCKAYNVYFLMNSDEVSGQFLSTVPAIPYDMDVMKEKGIEYVTVNLNVGRERKAAFINELEKEGKVVAAFSPYIDGDVAPPRENTDKTFMAIGSEEIYPRNMTGPVIVIYKIKR